MTDVMQGVVVPVTAQLQIEETFYELSAFEITFVVNGPSTAQCDLSVGFKGDKSGTTGAGLLTHKRGVPAKVILTVAEDVIDPVSNTLLIRNGVFDGFTGLLDDFGPGNLTKGNFNLRVSLVSDLAVLATGSLQLHHLIASSHLDTTVPMTLSGHTSDAEAEISPVGSGFTQLGLEADAWKEIQRVFTTIAGGGITGRKDRGAIRDFQARFGDDVNTDAIAVIEKLTGELSFNDQFKTSGVIPALATYFNILFTNDFRMQSFYNRTVSLGQEFKYRIIENFAGAKVIPYSPFFQEAAAIPIYPSTVTDMNWANREPNSVLGVAMTLAGPALDAPDDADPTQFIGSYKRPVDQGSAPLGAIVTIPSPPWMANKLYYKDITYGVTAPISTIGAIADTYAKEMGLELAYRGYGLQITGPLRFDIGLCTPVQVIYPNLPGINIGPSVYGSVQMVKLCMDAVKKQAYTTMEIGYARSDRLQAQELSDYQHPIWAAGYAGARLDAAG